MSMHSAFYGPVPGFTGHHNDTWAVAIVMLFLGAVYKLSWHSCVLAGSSEKPKEVSQLFPEIKQDFWNSSL